MTAWQRKEVIGDCTLYLGDCMEVMPTLERVDAVVTDPPYGINLKTENYTTKKGKKHGRFKRIENDETLNVTLLRRLFDFPCENKVIFGSNNFPELLPHSGRTICWDKRCTEAADKLFGSPFELAWENRFSGYDRIVRVQHGGVINADSVTGNSEKRHHPTQKPVVLIKHILKFTPYNKSNLILDPFMGSGTTGVACVKMGRSFIGIEQDPEYFEIACKRIREAYAQPDIFLEAQKQDSPKLEQASLLDIDTHPKND